MPQEGKPLAHVGPCSVLIVNRSESTRRTLRAVFDSWGYRVDEAVAAEEALLLLAYRDYSAILCDLAMPGMRGDQLFFACRRRCPDKAQRFIFVTGDVVSTWTAYFLATARQPYLTRPFRVNEIQSAIANLAPLPAA